MILFKFDDVKMRDKNAITFNALLASSKIPTFLAKIKCDIVWTWAYLKREFLGEEQKEWRYPNVPLKSFFWKRLRQCSKKHDVGKIDLNWSLHPQLEDSTREVIELERSLQVLCKNYVGNFKSEERWVTKLHLDIFK